MRKVDEDLTGWWQDKWLETMKRRVRSARQRHSADRFTRAPVFRISIPTTGSTTRLLRSGTGRSARILMPQRVVADKPTLRAQPRTLVQKRSRGEGRGVGWSQTTSALMASLAASGQQRQIDDIESNRQDLWMKIFLGGLGVRCLGGSFDELAVDEGGAGADEGDQWAVDRAPAVLGGLDQLERHGQPRCPRARATGDLRPVPDGRERALDGVRNRYERPRRRRFRRSPRSWWGGCGRFTVRPSGTGALGVKQGGQAGVVPWAGSPC